MSKPQKLKEGGEKGKEKKKKKERVIFLPWKEEE